MGLNYNELKYLLWARENGLDFSRMCVLGRQKIYSSLDAMEAAFSTMGLAEPRDRMRTWLKAQGGYAEPVFEFLGAKEVHSIDASDYEGASQVLDMNEAVPKELHDRFSLVLDSGSLEHVFNFPVAIRNCMEMVQVGGRFLCFTPCNNYMGHGFYQFSPELFFRIFTDQNGFAMENMILYESAPMSRWYQVRDPVEISARAEALTLRNTLLIVQARRTALKAVLTAAPQQSDYAAQWRISDVKSQAAAQTRTGSSVVSRLRTGLPRGLKQVLWRLREWKQPRIHSPAFQEIHLPHTKQQH